MQDLSVREALFFDRLDDASVRCSLCRHRCLIKPGRRGTCGVRENRSGCLVTLVYGNLVAENIDPVEKKPLFHFLPGSTTYSIATVGCNLHCLHCQNYSIAQVPAGLKELPGTFCSPDEVVRRAVAAGCRSVSFTYTEPTVFFEFALETARLAKAAGLKTIFVSNGYITSEALEMIAPLLDAANIDLKGFSEDFYRKVTGAQLAGVLECIQDYRRHGIWLELTTLVIPGLNDTDEELSGIARFIASSLGVDVPWHVSRFYPMHRMVDRSPTPASTLLRARALGHEAGLRHIYPGNVPGLAGEDTVCPGCGETLIRRRGFIVTENRITGGGCPSCGTPIAGVDL